MCTADYNPVCGQPKINGAQPRTYSNSCTMMQDGATLILQGVCETKISTNTDRYGCNVSEGFSYDSLLEQCVNSWNAEKIFLWSQKAQLTTLKNLQDFSPDRNITREEVTAIVERAFKNMLLSPKTLSSSKELIFEDKNQIASEFVNSVMFVQNTSIVRGNGKNFFPKSSISNYEILIMLARSISSDNNISNEEAEKLIIQVLKQDFSQKDFLNSAAKRSDVFNWIREFMYFQKKNTISSAKPIEALTSGEWKLDYIIDLNGKIVAMPEGMTLIVSSNGISARICNILNAEISLTDKEIIINGQMVGTRMYCDSPSIRYAEQYFINKKASYSFSSDNRIMTFMSDMGVRYVFSKR